MTGAAVLRAGQEDDPHARAVVTLDDGSSIAYRDVRRFGTWLLLEPDEIEPYLETRVGPEPLASSYHSRDLAAGLAGRRAPLKAALLDQRTVAGVGNIYADEALWRAACIHSGPPRARAGRDQGAPSLRPRRLGPGSPGKARRCATTACRTESGGMQDEFKVYGRGGEPCERCGTPIDKIRVAGRGTWYCPSCQRLVE